jgi:hypothetical protein
MWLLGSVFGARLRVYTATSRTLALLRKIISVQAVGAAAGGSQSGFKLAGRNKTNNLFKIVLARRMEK